LIERQDGRSRFRHNSEDGILSHQKSPLSTDVGELLPERQANTKLTRDLDNGFRSQGSFNSANVEKVLLLKDNIEVVVRATGTLRVVYTP
jgi:hypothetical protein